MKYKKVLFFLIGFLLLFLGTMAKPPMFPGDGAAGLIIACIDMHCDRDAGPVCGIDATGMMRTFENECFVHMAYCNEGRYYAVISDGEC